MSCIIIFQIKVMIRIIMTSNLNQQEIIRFLEGLKDIGIMEIMNF